MSSSTRTLFSHSMQGQAYRDDVKDYLEALARQEEMLNTLLDKSDHPFKQSMQNDNHVIADQENQPFRANLKIETGKDSHMIHVESYDLLDLSNISSNANQQNWDNADTDMSDDELMISNLRIR